jgi:hypothetical protein
MEVRKPQAPHPERFIRFNGLVGLVENWFARIQRDVITRDVFTSTKDLDKKLMRYIP